MFFKQKKLFVTLHFGSYIFNMQGYINRNLEQNVLEDLTFFPIVAVIGPRQSGKSTMVKAIANQLKNFIYLDLERPADLNKLEDAELFFEANKEKNICLDEIQRKPDLFPVMRSFVDRHPGPGKFIVLGSASPDLLRQSSESLAGRIAYLELTPFLISEVYNFPRFNLNEFWVRGGYPRSFLAPSTATSFRWRENFITTFIERDIPQLGFPSLSPVLRRFLMLCAHSNGQVANFSKLGEALGVTHHTIKRYLDVLQKAYILRLLPPLHANIKKRLIKSPKIYFRDSGIFTAMLGIKDFNELLGHPLFGSSWETLALENILAALSNWQANFYRTSSGVEIDLILSKGKRRIAVEFKASLAPKVGKGFFNGLSDLEISESWIIAPVSEAYPLKKNLMVSDLYSFIQKMKR